VLLPTGKVLLVGSPAPACSYPGPSTFHEYDPATNTATVVSAPTDASGAAFTTRFLLLPTGEVLYSADSGTLSVYKPSGSPKAAWKPTISDAAQDMVTGHTYVISGTQLNGLSQACSYGDDAQMATNYPLVRLTNTATGKVRYLPTSHHSTMGVATGSTIVTTNVTVPMDTPVGQYSMVVVANGIASSPVTVDVAKRGAFLIVDRSTFGQGEIQAMIDNAGSPATIDPAVYVVVEGYKPSELGLTSGNLANPPGTPSIPTPVGGVTFEFSGPVVPEVPCATRQPAAVHLPDAGEVRRHLDVHLQRHDQDRPDPRDPDGERDDRRRDRSDRADQEPEPVHPARRHRARLPVVPQRRHEGLPAQGRPDALRLPGRVRWRPPRRRAELHHAGHHEPQRQPGFGRW